MQEMMKKRAAELLSGGKVNRVLGWKTGDFVYDVTPAVFETAEEIENDFVYTAFCRKQSLQVPCQRGKEAGSYACVPQAV